MTFVVHAFMDAKVVKPAWDALERGERAATRRCLPRRSGSRPARMRWLTPTMAGSCRLASSMPCSTQSRTGGLLVLGGGSIGCELGQAFSRLGAEVTIVERARRLLPLADPDAGELIAARLEIEGIDVQTGALATEIRGALAGEVGHRLMIDSAGGQREVSFDQILLATGRSPRTDGLGLATVGVELDAQRAIVVDARLRTTARRIFAVGDVTGLLPFTHVAAHHARVATPQRPVPRAHHCQRRDPAGDVHRS